MPSDKENFELKVKRVRDFQFLQNAAKLNGIVGIDRQPILDPNYKPEDDDEAIKAVSQYLDSIKALLTEFVRGADRPMSVIWRENFAGNAPIEDDFQAMIVMASGNHLLCLNRNGEWVYGWVQTYGRDPFGMEMRFPVSSEFVVRQMLFERNGERNLSFSPFHVAWMIASDLRIQHGRFLRERQERINKWYEMLDLIEFSTCVARADLYLKHR